ncbi:pyridoxal phosphate-dependent aminotransferase [uncultured Methanolobus sp.]|uniref:pyridoxal phosphate-dependent aminotransferase n=1 Tax=uncultured Methanolobus sp. TaxID=218300 RepID=UPI002AAA8D62|nr:pyridoxal phosphate-dependent aminotransferase [uncultured Methanolobus sp.]
MDSNKQHSLSNDAYKIEGQPMFKVLQKVQKREEKGENIIHFEIGDPDFNTPNNIIEAVYRSMKDGFTHYTDSMGMPKFREVVSKATLRSRGFAPSLDQILVTPGANIIIYLAVKCLANPGDEVIVPDPGFPTYYSVLKFCDVVPVRIPLREENKFRMDPDDVRKAITPKTKLIIINSPNNPTGSVMKAGEMDEIFNIAKENDIYLLSDEIYSRMMYDTEERFHSPSMNDACLETTIVANGFSKAFAMTGWRLGVAIGPEDIIEKMGLLVQTLISCTPPFIQHAGIAAIEGEQSEVELMMDEYKARRDFLVAGLNKLPGITCLKNEGAFYVFPNITGTGMNSEEFADFMLKNAKVALLPGTNFGHFGEGYVRLSYATSLENIEKGLKRMNEALNKIQE